MLINELFENDYEFVLISKFKNHPIEQSLSQYRQMCCDQFLVDLKEFINSEGILSCRELIKTNKKFWKGLTAEKHKVETKNEIYSMHFKKFGCRKQRNFGM